MNALGYADASSSIVSAGDDKVMRIWSMQTRTLSRVIKLSSGFAMVLAVTSDCGYVAFAGEDTNINLLKVLENEEQIMRPLIGHSSYVSMAKIGSNDRTMVSASRDNTIRVWDILKRKQLACFSGHVDRITCVVITWDCCRVISAGLDKGFRIWNIKDQKEELAINAHTNWVPATAINRLGNTIATASADKSIKLWGLQKKRNICSLLGHTGEVQLIGNRFGSRLISVGSEDAVIIWDTLKKTVKNRFQIPSKEISEIILIEDKKMFVTREDKKIITVWSFHNNIAEKLKVWDFRDKESVWPNMSIHAGRSLITALNASAFFVVADRDKIIGFWKINQKTWSQSMVNTKESTERIAVCKGWKFVVSSSLSLLKVSVWKINRPEQ